MLKHLAEKREHEREVALKAAEEHNNFVRLAKEKLEHRMEANKEKRQAHIAAMLERLQEKVREKTWDPPPSCSPPIHPNNNYSLLRYLFTHTYFSLTFSLFSVVFWE